MMAVDTGVDAVFEEYSEYLCKENDVKEGIRDVVKDLEQSVREIQTILQRIHRPGGVQEIGNLAESSRSKFEKIKSLFKELEKKVPEDSYWRYNNLWNHTTSRISYLSSLIIYLESEKMASRPEVAAMMGLKIAPPGFYLDLEDYLGGLTFLSNELSRFSVNCVTSEDYDRPVRISEFISSLNTGFRMLNLKNDGLRKKFDGLKVKMVKMLSYII
jgi:hypothetical protein